MKYDIVLYAGRVSIFDTLNAWKLYWECSCGLFFLLLALAIFGLVLNAAKVKGLDWMKDFGLIP